MQKLSKNKIIIKRDTKNRQEDATKAQKNTKVIEKQKNCQRDTKKSSSR